MATRTWRVCLDDTIYEVRIEHGWASAERKIYLNGDLVVHEPPSYRMDWGSRHDLTIGSYTGTVIVHSNGWTFDFELLIEGQPAEAFAVPSDYLLRPSQSPPSSPEELLRPAAGSNKMQGEELLRAADRPDSVEP